MRYLAILASLIFMACPEYSFAHELCAPCDFDGSGTLTVADARIMVGAFGTKRGEPGFDSRVDYDGSGSITLKDWAVYLKFCAKEN